MAVKSLSFRLLVSEGLVLIAFFALVIVVLEQSFRENAEHALSKLLESQVHALMLLADLNNVNNFEQLKIPLDVLEPRFTSPDSGLYGFIQQPTKGLMWRSPSAIGLDIPEVPKLSADQSIFLLEKKKRYVFHHDHRTRHITINGIKERVYVFTVAEDARFVTDKVEQFRATLRYWLLGIGVVLVFIQFSLLRWSLKPLRLITEDLEAIEQGKKTHLDGKYPTELQGLTGNLNVFITHERAHMERYRNTLADLTHSLKTPLAILRGCVNSFGDDTDTAQEQITRMDKIVEYQLQKAAAKGVQNTIKSVDLADVIRKIRSSLSKVYLDKGIHFDIVVADQCQIYCEEGDIYEIVGNLMDNACKWCNKNVKVSIYPNQRKARRNFSVMLQIEDDGPGIPVGKFNEILKRGVRADENIHGHGIGVSVVSELVGLLGGKLEGGESAVLHGMRWSVYLP